MTPYSKTNWINDETELNEDNMNKIEEQLEILTNNAIAEGEKGYATEDYVTTQISNAIGQVLGGSY